MELIKFQLNHCYSTTSSQNDQTYFFILKKRTKKKCTFLEISQNELHQKPRLHTCAIDVELGQEANNDHESCTLSLDKTDLHISSTDETTTPQYQFNDQDFYIANAHSGRRKIYYLHILKREGNNAYVELYGTPFKSLFHTRILKPVNGYYELLNLIVEGEQLSFKSNYYKLFLHKPSPQKAEVAQDSADSTNQNVAKAS